MKVTLHDERAFTRPPSKSKGAAIDINDRSARYKRFSMVDVRMAIDEKTSMNDEFAQRVSTGSAGLDDVRSPECPARGAGDIVLGQR